MARRSLADLQKQIDNENKENNNNKNNTGGLFYPFWNLPKDGSTRLRILEDPNEDNPLIVYVNYLEHKLEIGDDFVRIPCRKNHGMKENCPICDLSQKYYKANNKVKGKYYYRDKFALLRAIIVEDGLEYEDDNEDSVGKVRALKFSYQLAEKLKADIGKLDSDEVFWDLDEGLDFIIEKQVVSDGNRQFPKYDTGSGFARRATSIPEEFREEIDEDATLDALIPEVPSYDEISELLQKHLNVLENGDDDDDDDDETVVSSDDEVMEKISRGRKAKASSSDSSDDEEETKPKATKKKKAPEPEEDDDDDDLSSLFEDDDDDEDDDDLDLDDLFKD